MSLLRDIFKYCSFRTKHILSTSIILQHLLTGHHCILIKKKVQIRSLQTLLMKTTRPILGYQSFKWNTSHILNTLKWPNVNHLIITETLKFIHKPIFENLPPAITNLFSNSQNRPIHPQNLHIPSMEIKPNSEYLSKTLLHCSLHLYRLSPEAIISLNPKKFSKKIYEHLRMNWDPQKIPY